MGAKRVSKQGVKVSQGNAIEVTNASDAVVFSVDSTGTINDTVSATELGYLDGVTSAIQTQLDAKVSTATAASTYQPIVSGVDNTEIGYLNGVTSAIQTQLNTKAPTASPTFTGNVTSGASFVLPNDSYVYWGPGDGSTSLRGNSSTDVMTFTTTGATRMTIASNGATTVSYTTTSGGAVRNIYMSTSDPSGGSDGDVWIKYTA